MIVMVTDLSFQRSSLKLLTDDDRSLERVTRPVLFVRR